jgi:hypothetical protein
MFQKIVRIFMVSMLTAVLTLPVGAVAQETESSTPKPKGLQQRIDFGSSYILGQSIKSGAVYLMHRKQSDIKGMLEVRQDYRREIMEDYGLENTAITQESADQKSDK